MTSSLRPQIPSRRGTRRPRPARDTPRPCSSSRVRRHKQELLHGAQTTTNPPLTCWGRKRQRNASGGRTDALPSSSCTQDWANLGGDGPTGLIAELVLAGGDVADYVRFRAVCRPWRRCSPDPRAGLDGRFLPRRWIMLYKALAGPRRRRFLNVSSGECIRMDLPELDEHILLALTPEGLLLLLHTLVVRLLNPLTRQLTDLPPVTPLLPPGPPGFKPIVESDDLGVYGVGVTDDSTVAVCFSYPRVLAVAKPGDKHWTVVCKEYLDSALPFAGRFYCCVRNRVMVLDTSSCSNQQPRLLPAVEWGNSLRFSRMTDHLHLVDNAGELMLVHRLLYQVDPESNFRWTHKAYGVDLDARALVPAKAFGRRAVFIGHCRTISVTAEAFPSAEGGKLYFGSDYEETCAMYQSDGYKLEDGSIVAHPFSVINCLSHCIQGSGDHLA